MKFFLFCEITYVGHEGNNVAHNLAKLAACLGLKRQWRDECRDCISEIIRVEQMIYLIDFDNRRCGDLSQKNKNKNRKPKEKKKKKKKKG
jgi:hypothetical protein